MGVHRKLKSPSFKFRSPAPQVSASQPKFATCALCSITIVIMAGLTTLASAEQLKPASQYGYHVGESLLRNSQFSVNEPYVQVASHDVGNIQVGHTNLGHFGTGFLGAVPDPVTGNQLPSCTFPSNSSRNFLYIGAIWIGATVGRDTLVSTGADDFFIVHEFWPASDKQINDTLTVRSFDLNNKFYNPQAISEQDIISIYYDTLKGAITGQDEIDNRPHSPLNIRVVERSLQWSYDYASDFVLFDYEITNIGFKTLDNVYMGIYIDGDVHHLSKTGLAAYGDDICGFKQTFEAECGFQDTVNVAYIFDNDGDPEGGLWSPSTSVRSLAGVRLIRTPSDTLEYAFNWWSAIPGPDFGPRKRGTLKNPFRDMNGIFGAPVGDKNKYYIMRNGEFDYDQLFTAVDHTAAGWLPPPPEALTFVQGGAPRYLLSFGPFKIFPGETLPITFAYLGGEFFHGEPDDFNTLLVNNPFTPEDYYNSLDFSDLSRNSRWASWIYDNPGVDTDGDKDFGKFRICVLEEATVIETTLVIDTIVIPPDTVFDTVLIIDTMTIALVADTNFYAGDGVPDFRGAAPPPAPKVRLIPDQGLLTVRWNGFISETTKDPFSDTADFEGFRVWTSPTLQEEDFVLKSSFDHENYNRYVFNRTENVFELLDPPFTLEQIHNMYGVALEPLNFGIDNPFIFYHQPSGTDTTYYFTAQDWNADDLSDTTAIHKRFPNALEPSAIPSEWTAEDTTDEGYLKYYEYQFYLEDLLPSIPLYVSVTAFDFGSPSTGLGSLESSPRTNAVLEFPQISSAEAQARGLDVIVYPNPYRIDGDYRSHGFEGREREDLPDQRVRALNFTNLPHQCLISIFSLDGDLIHQFQHDFPLDAPGSMHDAWNLITRNSQLASSGIYYFTIETPAGATQIGKFALIM